MAGFVAGVVVATVVGTAIDRGGAGPATLESKVELRTVAAESRTMRTYLTYEGTLEVGSTEQLTSGRSGTVTSAAEAGTTLGTGDVLATIDNAPVSVLYGDVPMYRALESGDEGTDVRQLETFLAVHGYDTSAPITVDETFTSATASALRNWQEATEQEETGALAAGALVVVPGPVEVLEPASVGEVVRNGAALATVSTGPVVIVNIQDGRPLPEVTEPARPTITLSVVPGEIDSFAVGDSVEVESSDGTVSMATVTEVGSIATSDPQDPDSQPGVAVTIELDPASDVLAGPAQVRVVDGEHVDVVAVPTRALAALAEGGHAVEVADNERRRLVGVELGIFADGWVEITSDSEGGAVVAGTQVLVPS